MSDGFWRLRVHEVLPSTSDLCRHLAEVGEPEGLAVIARRQSAGRGSRGRTWESPRGNLYLSVLLRPKERAGESAQWSLLAGVALAEALSPLVPNAEALRLKWPNDLLLDGRKLAGVLIDGAANDAGLAHLVIGMGVNLAVAPAVPGKATICVGDVAAVPDAEEVGRAVLDRLAAWRRRRLLDGFAPVRAAWQARGLPVGSPMTLRVGGHLLGGAYVGLGEDGSLFLQSGGRVHAFTAGEVLLPEERQDP